MSPTVLLFRAKIASHMQKTEKQMLDRVSAFLVIRSMCSPQLNAILVVDPIFIAVAANNPFALLATIKNVATSRCDGNIELERAQALRDWYTLTMREGEDVVDYGRRSASSARDSRPLAYQSHNAHGQKSNPSDL
jgi:hypothetical protein